MTEVYLASTFDLANRVEAVHEALKADGHYVRDVWWRDESLSDAHAEAGADAYYRLPEVEEMAHRHYRNLARTTEAFVLVAPPREPRKFNGANVELGFALAQGLPTFAYGRLERSAMYHPVGRFDDLDALVAAVRGVSHA